MPGRAATGCSPVSSLAAAGALEAGDEKSATGVCCEWAAVLAKIYIIINRSALNLSQLSAEP